MSLSINLIRDNISNNDDVISIRRKNDMIHVSYCDRQQSFDNKPGTSSKQSKQELLLGKNDLARYIQNLGILFLNDAAPFCEAQFNFPGFPSFLVNQKSLKNTDTQDALMEIAELVSASWFAEDYSDMPPLVKMGSNSHHRHGVNLDDEYTGHY